MYETVTTVPLCATHAPRLRLATRVRLNLAWSCVGAVNPYLIGVFECNVGLMHGILDAH